MRYAMCATVSIRADSNNKRKTNTEIRRKKTRKTKKKKKYIYTRGHQMYSNHILFILPHTNAASVDCVPVQCVVYHFASANIHIENSLRQMKKKTKLILLYYSSTFIFSLSFDIFFVLHIYFFIRFVSYGFFFIRVLLRPLVLLGLL